MKNYVTKKFLGSNTGEGFRGFYGDILYGSGFGNKNQSIYILKGGPGTGKSTFIKKVASMLEISGCDTELLLCSGDVKSLDGVSSKAGGITVVDGTNPHSIEPACVGVHENIINLGDFWNREILKKYSSRIEDLYEKKKLMYKKAYHYLAAANEIYKDRADTVNRYVDRKKVELFADIFSQELIPQKNDAEIFGIKRRAFATAITAEGIYGAIPGTENCDVDEPLYYSLSSKLDIYAADILEKIAKRAVLYGYDVDMYYCGFDCKKLEHIVIPELNIAVVTSNDYHSLDGHEAEQDIIMDGFLFESITASREKCMDFDIGYAKIRYEELLERTFRALKNASAYHREMEDYYVESMDFAALNDYTDYMLSEMAKVIHENVLS